ncbi:MAG: HEAT repeat domain-containing protein, partial [Opitutales bacterium]
DQYVFHAHHPEFKVGYSWDQKAKLAKISVKQEQKVDENVMLFQLSLPIRFRVGDQSIDRSMPITKASEDFYFALPSAPEVVRIDPELTILAKTTFAPPNAMIHAQLTDPEDVIGRLLAVELLGKRKDQITVDKLKEVLNKDSFHGVRLAASKALRGIGSEAAFKALTGSTKQPDARVRRQVVTDLGSFYKPEALAVLKKSLGGEKNPAVRAAAIRALPGFGDAGADGLVRQALVSTSFRHELADAAVSALRKQDDPANLAILLKALLEDSKKFSSRGYGSGMRALAYLARNEEDKSKVRRFLLDRASHLNARIRLAAIDSLGQLGDPKAIATLEKFAAGGEGSPERRNAEAAIEKLRAVRKPVDDFKNLRQEVTDLKKANENLGKQLDDLKKRFEAAAIPEAKK